ncbi:MAG TPA: TldD/PmbA family protein [Gemmatimonadaceae bacterium]|nr:TldD/PmbA family protein [Gemmatimonadaceae bacterium]
MAQSRRDFLRNTSAALAAIGTGACGPMRQAPSPPASTSSPALASSAGDASVRDLALLALDAARSAGADYADVRISRNRNQSIATREQRVQNLTDNETFGFGVRVLVGGAWGFAASQELARDEVGRVARQAVAQARANRSALVRPVVLAPAEPTASGVWRSPARLDPFDVAIEDKVALLLDANRAAMAVASTRFVNSQMFFLREEKTYANTDGTYTVQTIYRTQPSMTVTAVSADRSDFQTRASTDIQPHGLGYEHVIDARLIENAPRWAEEAAQKLSARPVDVGRYDLVLHPSHLWLTIHEAIAHPTELDRAMGYEANYAGTSFLAPPEDVLGKFRYGPEFMNVQGDRSQPGSLAACGWDDDGVRPRDYLIVKDGIFNDYQTTREQALWLDWWYRGQGQETRSHGCSYAQSWADIQFQRMPNVSLLPGEQDLVWDDLIAATDRGIAIVGNGSFSIDQQRYNAQFGGQLFYEIRGGRIVGMLKDVAYQISTPEFWNAMDMIGGRRSYELGGAFGDAKGQPSQSNAVSHGCVPTRHRQIAVINTGRRA